MLRQIFGAALALGLSTAASFSAVIPIFDGTFVFTNAANNCSATGSSYPAIYRPQLNDTDQRTGLVVSLYRAGVGFTLPGNGQFNSSGPFIVVQLSQSATVKTRTGAYDVTQVPATVGAGTQTVTLTGHFTPTGAGAGCQYVFKASFLRRPGT